MPFGVEVSLGPGDIVLDGNQAPLTEMGTAAPPPPIFGACLVAKRSPISATAKLWETELLHSYNP